jgi:pimeloyl-ACP methyl ester carboxylesterase
MLGRMPRVFLPGYGAPPEIYASLLHDWRVPRSPAFARSRGSLDPYRRWALGEVTSSGTPVTLAGHSFGAALAIMAAAERPELVRRLVLVGPAGLPLTKPIRRSLAAFAGQLARGRYPWPAAARAGSQALRAPRQALRLAHQVRSLDLRDACARVREAGVPTTVIGCTTDTLVTCRRSGRLAELLGARHLELDLAGGHMWMLHDGPRLARELALASV